MSDFYDQQISSNKGRKKSSFSSTFTSITVVLSTLANIDSGGASKLDDYGKRY